MPGFAPLDEATRLLRAARPLALLRLPPQDPALPLPPARIVLVPGRGPVFVRESPGPPGSLPVLLLHPWSWTADVAFAATLGPLAARHRVVAMDLRGHGRSVGVSGPVQLADFVDDALGLMDVLGIERAVLLGHSLGGIVSMATALRAPQRVAGLVVAGAAACYTLSRRDRLVWRALHAARPLAFREIGRSLPLRYFLPSTAADASVLRRWRWMEAELGRNTVRAMWEIGRMVAGLDLRDALARRSLDVPAVYVLLTRDTICAPFMQHDTARRLGAHVIELATDHDVPVAAPDVYQRALLQALERVTRTGPDQGRR